ncbi:AAA family ATPase [Chondrinema litorale]|uniref:AAA family ATPase n=1 Tax=Chondrinema litorale TaxID=2994555 RepID=UPI002542D8B0|nr:AAA family ATPase [Chondrinema litorale]UZR96564.1 AAA family ATPase [Chondrinema litorale]
MATYGKHLKAARTNANLQIKDVTEQLNITKQTLINYESSKTEVPFGRLEQMAELYGVSIDVLTKGEQLQAKVFSFINRKGGVGKTTLCNLLAVAFAQLEDLRILVIDTDSQKSTMQLADEGVHENIEVQFIDFDSNMPISDLLDMLEENMFQFDFIFIDVMGSFSHAEATATIMFKSDFVIIPLEASDLAMGATFQTLGMLPEIAEKRGRKNQSFTPIGIHNKSSHTKESRSVSDLNGMMGLKLLNNKLSNRVRYKRRMSFKELPFAFEEQDEFLELVEEIKTVVNNG